MDELAVTLSPVMKANQCSCTRGLQGCAPRAMSEWEWVALAVYFNGWCRRYYGMVMSENETRNDSEVNILSVPLVRSWRLFEAIDRRCDKKIRRKSRHRPGHLSS